MTYATTFDRDITRQSGDLLCNVIATPRYMHPVALRFGPATVTLTKADALAMAHALVEAVTSLPKGV